MTGGSLHFSVPPTFRPLDVGSDPTTRAEGLLAATGRLDPDQRVSLVIAQELLVERLRLGGAIYAAHVLGRVDDDRPRLSVGFFSVVLQSVGSGAAAMLDEFAARLTEPGLGRIARTLQLPAGPALAVMEDREVIGTVDVLGQPRHRAHAVRQVQVMLPLPDRRRLAVLALATECVHDWDAYATIMGVVARSVSVHEPAARTFDQICPAPAGSTCPER